MAKRKKGQKDKQTKIYKHGQSFLSIHFLIVCLIKNKKL
jgi:hypothetical protein